MDIKDEKTALRAEMKSRIAAMSHDEMTRQSITACMRLTQSSEFINADTVLVYKAMKGECDPQMLADIAYGMGKRVAYPRCEGSELGLYLADEGQLVSGVFGILEPDESCQRITIDEVDFAVIPGAAFDKQGGRLGRGKGYYDRLLKEAKAVKAGLCFNEQLVERVPMESHDGRMNMIAAENGIYC
ncbi:MAG: 5-formyltetrahydrofolate cyclo-ligase [Clostridia bacterium]|nr:5-formyltetrahydrofolate cyclo-ligase [Clostridia bacterium]